MNHCVLSTSITFFLISFIELFDSFLRLFLFSLHDDVRRGHEHSDGGDDGEGREGDEAEPVDHHRRELPVHDDLLLLVPDLHAVRDELELLQDALQLAVG